MSRDEIKHDAWGDLKIEHYGNDGTYLGSTRIEKNAWDETIYAHYDSDGTYIGSTTPDD